MDTPLTEDQIASLRRALEVYVPLGRSGLLPALHSAQKLHGWLSEPVAAAVAGTLRVPLAEVHGVIEFYSLLHNQPVGRRVISVCTDIACALKNGDQVLDHLCAGHGVRPGETSSDGAVTILPSPCLGLCEQAPTALVGEDAETNIAVGGDQYDLGRPRSVVGGSLRLLTAGCGNGTRSLEEHGEYAAFRKALTMQPASVVAEITSAGLVGRGGAAFPTGVKWAGAAETASLPKYVVCNADESEPGTFKDRVLLIDDPHTLIEGMLIAGYAVGAQRGYIYLRGEYPYILPVLEHALAEARAGGWLGSDLQGSTFSFDIEIRLGAGAYICGEETALFESIEGKRGFPRVKPPFPTTFGLFGKPTIINNVETLFNVPLIIQGGAAQYRRIGTEKSPGPKLFCLSGDVARAGVYEVPFGITLRELLEMAGGVAEGRALKAVLFGGAAGAFATSDHLDVRLTFENLRAAGLPLGSGVVMVFDERRDMRAALERLGHFFAHESCGKCYPCQMGSQRQKEILERLAAGALLPGDLERLQDVGWTMTDASLCGLGQTAATAVLSAVKLWPEMFRHQTPVARSQRATRARKTTAVRRKPASPSPNRSGRGSSAGTRSKQPKPAAKKGSGSRPKSLPGGQSRVTKKRGPSR
ncbi:MAG TPA: NAD(P)H-dependent oxidoreductase subunit E [Anaerolineales bacterium]|nr:NAD(P)H-dependent oxidoreductase subunit E [Anaerolineales bacterium]